MKSIFSVWRISLPALLLLVSCSGVFNAPDAPDAPIDGRQVSLRSEPKAGDDAVVPVRLKYAHRTSGAVSGMSYGFTRIRVKVRNLGFQKEVLMHYARNARQWATFPLEHRSHHGSYDVFGSDRAPETVEFCIKYVVNGATFWDNNGGLNYRLPGSDSGVVGGNVVLNRAVVSGVSAPSGPGSTTTVEQLQGEILVNNLAFRKAVVLHYRDPQNGAWYRAAAAYAGRRDGVELWTFSVQSRSSRAPWQFAVGHESPDGGYSFWDNNFGMNYHGKLHDTAFE